MGEATKIQWADHTFNPWRGCSKVSAGCANCYADAQARRNPGVLGIWGPNGTRVVASDAMWQEPLKWNRAAACQCGDGFKGQHSPYCPQAERPRVFCASMADVFEDWQSPMVDSNGKVMIAGIGDAGSNDPWPLTMDHVRDHLFSVIDTALNLDWLLLTKRPENILGMLPAVHVRSQQQADDRNERGELWRPNVWYGTSVEDQVAADNRIPHLIQVPAKVRFLSCEPLLGPVDLSKWLATGQIHWVIIGGESGPNARPCNIEQIRDIVRQCQAAGVACFVKQLGSQPFDWVDIDDRPRPIARDRQFYQLSDFKGGDPSEWPEDVRVREVPA